MNTNDILKAITASALVIVSSGVNAGHEAPYHYDESTDTIVFSQHDEASPADSASTAVRYDSAQDSEDSFLDQ